MPILHAIVLGLTQGLSEFLPISSSEHLILVPWLFGWHDFDSDSVQKAFDVALHIGTLVAAIGYFRRDLVRYAIDAWKARTTRSSGVRPRGGCRG
jgi:undecaprenyl-diphosphatase